VTADKIKKRGFMSPRALSRHLVANENSLIFSGRFLDSAFGLPRNDKRQKVGCALAHAGICFSEIAVKKPMDEGRLMRDELRWMMEGTKDEGRCMMEDGRKENQRPHALLRKAKLWGAKIKMQKSK